MLLERRAYQGRQTELFSTGHKRDRSKTAVKVQPAGNSGELTCLEPQRPIADAGDQ